MITGKITGRKDSFGFYWNQAPSLGTGLIGIAVTIMKFLYWGLRGWEWVNIETDNEYKGALYFETMQEDSYDGGPDAVDVMGRMRCCHCLWIPTSRSLSPAEWYPQMSPSLKYAACLKQSSRPSTEPALPTGLSPCHGCHNDLCYSGSELEMLCPALCHPLNASITRLSGLCNVSPDHPH